MSDTNCDQSSDDVLYSQICYLFFFWQSASFYCYLLFKKASCVCPAVAGCLGSGCDWWHLCGCQQQVQADGLWLRQVHVSANVSLSRRLPTSFTGQCWKAILGVFVECVCVCVVQRGCCQCGVCVCPVWESVSLCLLRLSSVYSSGTPHAEQ